jgi:hypothetical protein
MERCAMRDHQYYEELTALAAGGQLSADEAAELGAHLGTCFECRESARVYRDLVVNGLPEARATAVVEREMADATLDPDARGRFFERARGEGIMFSDAVFADSGTATAVPARRWLAPAAALALAATVVLAVVLPQTVGRPGVSPEEVERLKSENAVLSQRVTAREQELAGREDEIRRLEAALAAAARKMPGRSVETELAGLRLGQSVSREARLLEELQNRERQLEAASQEIRRINQLQVTDRAELEAVGARLRQASHELRVATATLDMERQLAAAGKDILQLMLAKQLRVVDVRDTGADGRPAAAFARMFVAEGRVIRIYAFDLNERTGAPTRFQVWGERLGTSGSLRNLGVLSVDDRSQNRWSLSIQDADVVQSINSVFVTTSAADGQRLLYAHLGQPVP